MRVLLDSSFIVSCVRNRIDFLSQLEEQGFKVIAPREVMQELKDLKSESKTSHDDRIAINVALDLLSKRNIGKIKIGGKNVDEGLITRGREGYYVATLDAGIKRKIPNKVIIFRSKGKVGVG